MGTLKMFLEHIFVSWVFILYNFLGIFVITLHTNFWWRFENISVSCGKKKKKKSAILMLVHFPGYQISGSFYTYSPTETHPVAMDPNMRSAEAMAISGKWTTHTQSIICHYYMIKRLLGISEVFVGWILWYWANKQPPRNHLNCGRVFL